MKLLISEHRDMRAYRGDIVPLLERNFEVDGNTFFDWYYDPSDPAPSRSWLLRTETTDRLVGMCSVVLRQMAFGSNDLNVGVLGNLFVERGFRSALPAIRLVKAAMQLVRDVEIDALIGIPNRHSLPLTRGLGFRSLGPWVFSTHIVHSRSRLRSRLGWAGELLSPAVDLAATWLRRRVGQTATSRVLELSGTELANLDTNSWERPTGRLVGRVNGRYLSWRFARCPASQHRVFGLSDRRSKRLHGYVVVSIDNGNWLVVDCQADPRQTDELSAILQVFDSCKHEFDSFSVSTLEASPIASGLGRFGFIRRQGQVAAHTWELFGLWRDDHALAAQFADPSRWCVFRGVNDV